MTKKQLLKWLDEQKSDALLAVSDQEAQAKKDLKAEKIRKSGFDDLIAEIEPKLTEVFDRLQAWHMENRQYCGDLFSAYDSLQTRLSYFLNGNDSLADRLFQTEFHQCALDVQHKAKYDKLRNAVIMNYHNVEINLNALPNAKLGMEYLEGLGFDLTDLRASDEKPVETALARPVDTALLFLKKEETDEPRDL